MYTFSLGGVTDDIVSITWKITTLAGVSVNQTTVKTYNPYVFTLTNEGSYHVSAEIITICDETTLLANNILVSKQCQKPTNIILLSNTSSKYTFRISGNTTDVAYVSWKTTNAIGSVINQLTNNNADDFETVFSESGTYTISADIFTACGNKLSYKVDYTYVAPAFSLEKVWDKSFGGNGNDGIAAMTVISDGGTLIAGWSDSQPSGVKTVSYNGGLNDFWVIKVDASWSMVWQKGFGGTSNELLSTITSTSDGGALIGGLSNSAASGNKTSGNSGDYDYWVMKIDASGNKLWDKTFGGSQTDYLKSIVVTSDGGAILGGFSNSSISGSKTASDYSGGDYWVVKIDGNGNKLWDKSFGGSGFDDLNSVYTTSDGSILLGGLSFSGISGNKTSNAGGGADSWVIKLNSQGTKIWEKSFGGAGNEAINAISYTNDGYVLLGGITGSTTSGSVATESDFWLAKIDANGNSQWEKRYGGSGGESISTLAVTSENTYILGGYSTSNQSGNKTTVGYGDYDYWIVKVDANGNKLADNTFGGSGYDDLSHLFISPQKEIYLGGKSDSPISGNKTAPNYGQKDFWIVKIK
ncbi:hypothetical protein [Emticicia sp. SJ17W-69]|uniref:hypothetical protein n=1 Tax=Emticicia sp. SJ17W-69 TaxID=3421657 RepID=UPI003EBA6A52